MDWICKKVDPEDNEIRYTYDTGGNITEITSIEISQIDSIESRHVPAMKAKFTLINEIDSLNRVRRRIDNLGQTSYYDYDSRDNLIMVRDANLSIFKCGNRIPSFCSLALNLLLSDKILEMPYNRSHNYNSPIM